MADLYALPDPNTPFRSDAEMMAHVGSWRYQNDSAFREACEAKMAFGVPGATVMQAKSLSGSHRVITETMVEQAEAEEAQQQAGSLLIGGGIARVSFAAGETERVMGEVAQRARDAAEGKPQE
jgi:hypothetical protein